MDGVFEELNELDRDALKERMLSELPGICERLQISEPVLEQKAGISRNKLGEARAGRRRMKWSEYMSILFVLWNNDIGRGIVEDKGLFPDVLKKAMSTNRNAHPPAAGAGKYGL